MDKYDYLEDVVRNSVGSVVWSHKIQEKQADIYDRRFRCFEILKIIAASITSAGLVSLLFTDVFWVKVVSAIISFVSIFISAFFKAFNLNAMVCDHKRTAVALLSVRDRLIMLLLKVRMRRETPDNLYDEYEQIIKDLHGVYSEAPNTTDAAVEKAREALHTTQDNTFSDDEIDSYLPKVLRKEANAQ